MWLGFAVAVIVYQIIGGDLFPTPADGSYPLERAIGAALVGGGGALIGSFIGGLLGGASADNE